MAQDIFDIEKLPNGAQIKKNSDSWVLSGPQIEIKHHDTAVIFKIGTGIGGSFVIEFGASPDLVYINEGSGRTLFNGTPQALASKIQELFRKAGSSASTTDATPSHVNAITTTQISSWDAAAGGISFVNVLDYGADKTGVADSKAAFVAAIATGKDVFVPEGTFKIIGTGAAGASQITLADNQNLYGVGRKSVISITGNYRIVTIGENSEIKQIYFKGSGKASGASFQTGIFAYNKKHWLIADCYFSDFGGAAQQNGGGAVYVVALIGTGHVEGGRIINPWVDNNNGGLAFASKGEYVTVTNVKATNNTVGIGIGAGNIIINGGDVQKNTTGIKMFDGTNDGHGIVSGVTVNHNATNLNIDLIADGMTFSGCNFYAGNMAISNSTGIKFIGCDFDGPGNTITLTNNTLLLRANCRVPLAPKTNAMAITLVSGSTFIEDNNLDF